jgi:alpha-L-fucosidase
MRPDETVTVRGLPVRRVEQVTVLATGEQLEFTTRTGIFESLQTDPDGEVVITVPAPALDRFATVLAVDVSEPAAS